MTVTNNEPAAPGAAAGRNGQAPQPSPCPPCEEGITLGGRAGERALALFGMVAGAVILVMGIDLWTGGALSRAAGLGGSRDAQPGA